MNWLPALTTWQFALAGLGCAAGPVLIHLLNRRRYRTVHWAAMELLREALQRNRRIMQLRDILLLVLRTAAVLLLGLAMAQPYFSATRETFDGRSRLHAVLLVDNSLSMSYQTLDGTLLDHARTRAASYIEQLPPGSLISIVPLCGARHGYSPDPFSSKQQALESLRAITAVDREAPVRQALNEARRVCDLVPDVAQRVVLLSDQQRGNWRDAIDDQLLAGLPSLQVVDLSLPVWENASVAELRLQDELADVETPATIVVGLRYQGPQSSREVQLTLTAGERTIASRTVRLEAGQGIREVAFQFVFDQYAGQPGRAALVPITARITPDALPADDERHLVVPVVTSLPVVFVDQYGAERENSLEGRVGETRHLRALLAPVRSRDNAQRQLIQIRHLSLEQLNVESLADARLVVLAGLADPGHSVPLLRDYVQAGGQLLIAAGGDFDPAAWNDSAWLDGQGILPAPLAPQLLGALPDQAGTEWQPFTLDFASLQADATFQLAENSEQALRDLYDEPLFFQAVQVRLDDQVQQQIARTLRQQLGREFDLPGDLPETAQPRDQQRAEAEVQHLVPDEDAGQRERTVEQLVLAGAPRVLARFALDGRPPFLVERQMGQGQTLFVASSLLSRWNSLPMTNAFLMFDRLLRQRIRDTLPRLNFPAGQQLAVPLPVADRGVIVRLERPGPPEPTSAAGPTSNSDQTSAPDRAGVPGEIEYLDVGFLGPRLRGVVINQAYDRGLYRIQVAPAAGEANGPPDYETVLAVAGPPEEADLTPLSRDEFAQRIAADNVRWVGAGEPISLAGAQVRGQDLWRWLAAGVLLVLLVEIGVLSWSRRATAVREEGSP